MKCEGFSLRTGKQSQITILMSGSWSSFHFSAFSTVIVLPVKLAMGGNVERGGFLVECLVFDEKLAHIAVGLEARQDHVVAVQGESHCQLGCNSGLVDASLEGERIDVGQRLLSGSVGEAEGFVGFEIVFTQRDVVSANAVGH